MKDFGCIYLPLLVTPRKDRFHLDRIITFIGRQLCFFEKDIPIPRQGVPIEVMITTVLYSRYPKGHEKEGFLNHQEIRALILQPVDLDKHMLVAIDGFECSGTMCRTIAHGKETDGKNKLTSEDVYPRTKTLSPAMWLTPGRCGIFEASNINTSSNGTDRIPLRPTNVWVEKDLVKEKSGCGVRVAGLTRVSDGQWSHLVRY